MNQPILSICIPTFNRCDVLDETLRLLFNNLEFDLKKIEVIVSDNNSNDRTSEIVKKYPLVIYHRNEVNIKDKNYDTVLSLAKGRYIRLFNDTLRFKPLALSLMIEKIEYHFTSGLNLFFYDNMFNNKNTTKETLSVDQFIKEVSFYSTWIANFGIWKSDFEKISDRNRYSELQFVQVDWTFKILHLNKRSIIYFYNFFETGIVKNKGGYNVFDTFINNYLSIVKTQKISFTLYELEKFRLFRYFVYPWLVKLFVASNTNYSFDTQNALTTILKKYWYLPYIYPLLLLFWIKKKLNNKISSQ